jgi:type I restriction enzyme S subunit
MSASSTLPAGWTETTFGKVVSAVSVNDKKLPKGEYLVSGRFPVVDQGQQFIGGYSDDTTRVISDDLPVLVFGDHTRAFKYLNQPFVPGADGVKVLKPIGVDAKWLYEIAQALDFPDKGYARHYQHLKSARLLVPPLPEQRRIVAELEKQFTRLEAGVAALRRVQANLKRYRAAVLKAACEGQLVPTEAELHRQRKSKTAPLETGAELLTRILSERRKNWTGRGQYKEPVAPDTANLPPLPESWTWAEFGCLGEDPFNTVQTGPFGAQLHNTEFTETGVPVIAVGNLTGTGFRTDGLYYVTTAKAKQLSRYDVLAGDLLFARSGATLGKVCVAPEAVQDWRMTGHILRARLNRNFINTKIAVYALAALPAVRKQVFGNVRGVTRPGFNTGLLESIWIPLPPLAEQTRIVAEVERRLSVVEELESVVSANLQRATRLRQSILQKAFTGGLVATPERNAI